MPRQACDSTRARPQFASVAAIASGRATSISRRATPLIRAARVVGQIPEYSRQPGSGRPRRIRRVFERAQPRLLDEVIRGSSIRGQCPRQPAQPRAVRIEVGS